MYKRATEKGPSKKVTGHMLVTTNPLAKKWVLTNLAAKLVLTNIRSECPLTW